MYSSLFLKAGNLSLKNFELGGRLLFFLNIQIVLISINASDDNREHYLKAVIEFKIHIPTRGRFLKEETEIHSG